MILCLDVGNSQIFGGVFKNEKIVLRFRHTSEAGVTSDQLGLFLKGVLRENELTDHPINHIAYCSFVPQLDYSLRSACKKYFSIEPFSIQAGVKTGLKVKYRNPLEVGADRITNAIAAIHMHPEKNLIIVDFGTATTYCAITADKEYLGGIIQPGLRIAMQSLQMHAAKLPAVEIIRPKHTIGRSTAESIQSGLYYSQLSTIQMMTNRISEEYFANGAPVVIGTGGFSHLFSKENVFHHLYPDLVLQGLFLALKMNS